MTRSGFVLPTVLMTLLVIGVISFAMSLVATLELLSARSAANAVAARATAEGALALALAEVVTEAASGALAVPSVGGEPYAYGPWSQHGIAATALLRLIEPSAGEAAAGTAAVYALSADAEVGRAMAAASVIFVLEPDLTVLEHRR